MLVVSVCVLKEHFIENRSFAPVNTAIIYTHTEIIRICFCYDFVLLLVYFIVAATAKANMCSPICRQADAQCEQIADISRFMNKTEQPGINLTRMDTTRPAKGPFRLRTFLENLRIGSLHQRRKETNKCLESRKICCFQVLLKAFYRLHPQMLGNR